MKKQRKNTRGQQTKGVSIPFVPKAAAGAPTGGDSLPPLDGGETAAQVAGTPENPFMPGATDKASGLKIRSINLVVITAAVFLLVFFLCSSLQTSASYERLHYANDRYISCELAANQLKHASNYLTAQVRMFAITQEIKYMERYFDEALNARNREHAVDVMKTYLSDNYAYLYLDEACRYSYELMRREYHAMRLVADAKNYILGGNAAIVNSQELTQSEKAMSPEEKIQAAVTLTHDSYYQRYVDLIDGCVASCIRCVTEERARADLINSAVLDQQTFTQRVLAALLMLITLMTIFTVMRLVMWPMDSFADCIRHYQPLPMVGAYELRYLARAYNIMYNENQSASARLRHEAEHDCLTALYNRGTFDKMRQECRNRPVALMLVDVDLFKAVNDTYGHDAGDRVLQKVARLLEKNFRETDFPCRIGGDEFAVIMTDASPKMKGLIREKLRRVAEGLLDASDGVPAVTLSVGVAFNDRDNEDNIYKDADRALYAVKTRGRNGVEFYEDSVARARRSYYQACL